jgi:AcrR family transcriptional regulator
LDFDKHNGFKGIVYERISLKCFRFLSAEIMAKKIATTSIKSIVRAPKQDRARITVEAILESAFQILETEGLAGFKVATLAERSGYGVGTLYQYFENIDAVMLALVDLESERQRQTLLAAFSDQAARGVALGTRDLVNLMLLAFTQRRAAQKAIIEWALSRREVRSIEGRNTFLGQMLASVSVRSQGLQFDRLLNPTEMFVLSRSFLGTLRTAIWNDEADTSAPQFAQALTDLVDGYVHQLVKREAAGIHA